MKEVMIKTLVYALNHAVTNTNGYRVQYIPVSNKSFIHTTHSKIVQDVSNGKLLLDGHWINISNIESLYVSLNWDGSFYAGLTMKSGTRYSIRNDGQ